MFDSILHFVLLETSLIFLGLTCFFAYAWHNEKQRSMKYYNKLMASGDRNSSEPDRNINRSHLINNLLNNETNKIERLLRKIDNKPVLTHTDRDLKNLLTTRKIFLDFERKIVASMGNNQGYLTCLREQMGHFVKDLPSALVQINGDMQKTHEVVPDHPNPVLQDFDQFKVLLDQGLLEATEPFVNKLNQLLSLETMNQSQKSDLSILRNDYLSMVEMLKDLNEKYGAELETSNKLRHQITLLNSDHHNEKLSPYKNNHYLDSDLLERGKNINIDNDDDAFEQTAVRLQQELEGVRIVLQRVEKEKDHLKKKITETIASFEAEEANLKAENDHLREKHKVSKMIFNEAVAITTANGKTKQQTMNSSAIERFWIETERGSGRITETNDLDKIAKDLLSKRYDTHVNIIRENQVYAEKLEKTLISKDKKIQELCDEIDEFEKVKDKEIEQISSTYSHLLREKDVQIEKLKKKVTTLKNMMLTLKENTRR